MTGSGREESASTNGTGRSYVSNNGTTFTTDAIGNYMIRAAQILTGCDARLPTVKILPIAQTADGHFLPQCLGGAEPDEQPAVGSDPSPASLP